MTLDELIDMGKRSRHPTGKRFVPERRLQRVDPNRLMGRPMETSHLSRQECRVASVQTVGQNHHDGTSGHTGHAKTIIERPDSLSEPGSTRPVRHPLGCLAQGGIRIS